jgi:hypothetical protein
MSFRTPQTGKLSKKTLREQFKDYRFADVRADGGTRLDPQRAFP